MALAPSDVRGIVERVCARHDVLDACAKRDLGTVITVLNAHGLTQGQIAELTGILQGRLSEYARRKRTTGAVAVDPGDNACLPECFLGAVHPFADRMASPGMQLR